MGRWTASRAAQICWRPEEERAVTNRWRAQKVINFFCRVREIDARINFTAPRGEFPRFLGIISAGCAAVRYVALRVRSETALSFRGQGLLFLWEVYIAVLLARAGVRQQSKHTVRIFS